MRPPFLRSGGPLTPEEFALMGPVLAEIVKKFFPCDRVDFFPLSTIDDLAPEAGVHAGIARVEHKRAVFFDKLESRLFLPLWHDEEMIAVAALSGGDAFLLSRSDEIRLLSQTRQMSELLHDLRDDLRDNQTGLFNAAFFRRYLAAVSMGGGFTLGLLEIAIGSHRDLLQILAQLQRSSATLENYFSTRTPLCHLGSGIFGVFLPVMDDEKSRRSARFMVNWFRREGMTRARLALVAAGSGEDPETVQNMAWETLKKARLRGSFAWAVAGQEPAASLFAHPPAAVINRLRSRWRSVEEFSLILFRADEVLPESKPDLAVLLKFLCPVDSHLIPVDRQEAYLLPAPADPEAARELAATVQEQLAEAEDLSCSAGIAFYPCLDYGRGAIPVNCRKALLHASFFGRRALAVFDSVTLNISGDRYYLEGDLSGAVREYRLGLRLAPDSVNLLNSLGVALVEMGRRSEAREMFERAAAVAPEDFMAHYNLALMEVMAGNVAAAVAGLRRCLEIEPENSEAVLQLAALLIGEKRFQETVELLDGGNHPLLQQRHGASTLEVRDNLVRGVLYRYLGQAYKGLSRYREAIAAVEKAVICNPGSARAAALLGEIYLLAGEGLGPALSLCRKAVAIDAASAQAWTALGRVLLASGEYEEAEKSLRQARRLDYANPEICELLAEVFARMGRIKDAEAMRLRTRR